MRCGPRYGADVRDERQPFATLNRHGAAARSTLSGGLSIEAKPRIDDIVTVIERIGHYGPILQERNGS